jgi:hypothetical protein
MTRLPRIVTLLGSALLLAACGQLIGLGDYESVDGEGGEAGEASAGKAGRGGTGGGTGGSAGSGGQAGTASAGTANAGAGGSTAGTGGKGGMAGQPGTGGNAGATGGSDPGEGGAAGSPAGAGGEAGSAGAPGCRELTAFDLVESKVDDDEPTFLISQFVYEFVPNLGTSRVDNLLLEFYESADEGLNGAATGTFELGTDIDVNFETCARCLRVFQDIGSTALEKTFFATSGTLTVDPASLQIQGFPIFSLRDVTLVEVTIDEEDISTPVEGGECLHFAELDINRYPPPPEWTCPADYFWDGSCDCGCGALDPSCVSSYVSACEYCGNADSCGVDVETCSDVKVDENWTCVQPQPWTCLFTDYGDGFCDCGCGIADVDCADSSVDSCVACHCDDPMSITCEGATVDPADNALCLP